MRRHILGSLKFFNVIFLVGHFGFFLLSGEESVLADFSYLKSICQGYRRYPGDIRRKKLKKIFLRVDFEKMTKIRFGYIWDIRGSESNFLGTPI